MRYRVIFFIGVVTQLQFWHIHWLVLIQSVGDLHWQVPRTLQSCATEELLLSFGLRRPRNGSENSHACCSTLVYSTILWSQLSPATHKVYWVDWTTLFVVVTNNAAENVLPRWRVTCLLRSKSHIIFWTRFLKQQVAYGRFMREFIFSASAHTLVHSRTYIQGGFLIVTENMDSRRHNPIRTSCRLSLIDVLVKFSPFNKRNVR
jgi:hypothetical protein